MIITYLKELRSICLKKDLNSKEVKLSDGWDLMKAKNKNEKSGIIKNKITSSHFLNSWYVPKPSRVKVISFNFYFKYIITSITPIL